jgi:hypothetical protein
MYLMCYPPASPVRRNLHLLESGTVNSDGGQAAAANHDIYFHHREQRA